MVKISRRMSLTESVEKFVRFFCKLTDFGVF